MSAGRREIPKFGPPATLRGRFGKSLVSRIRIIGQHFNFLDLDNPSRCVSRARCINSERKKFMIMTVNNMPKTMSEKMRGEMQDAMPKYSKFYVVLHGLICVRMSYNTRTVQLVFPSVPMH